MDALQTKLREMEGQNPSPSLVANRSWLDRFRRFNREVRKTKQFNGIYQGVTKDSKKVSEETNYSFKKGLERLENLGDAVGTIYEDGPKYKVSGLEARDRILDQSKFESSLQLCNYEVFENENGTVTERGTFTFNCGCPFGESTYATEFTFYQN